MTPGQIAHRTRRAVDAAVHAGRAHGLAVTDAHVLYEFFFFVVHLAPSPVVARVPTVLPRHVDLDHLAGRQRTELDVAAWFADRGSGHPAQLAHTPGAGSARRLLDDVSGS
ncbi:hypothetical protein ACQP0I_13820 [Micromonospora carbonacea]|uniref:hypothetical protein n=1 Tax=Micromonospora carbonacea TaxID=47853 RepID=UPI003D98ED88